VNRSRRNFIKSSASVTAATLLPAVALSENTTLQNKPLHTVKAANGFELLIMATNWGFKGSMDDFCKAAKAAGYDGIEPWWPAKEEAQKELADAVKKYDLKLGVAATSPLPKFEDNLADFRKNLTSAATNSYCKPLYINCHTGKDHFNFEQGKAFFDFAIGLSEKTGVPIYHETHRSRMLYSAVPTKNYIDHLPKLRLNLDISHWCVVHHSLLDELKDFVDAALERADHIHARVGFDQGPQVSDPRAPEWEKALNAHLKWWDQIVERKKRNGERMTILTEFGPPYYMPALPYTRQPLADQWGINVYMMKLLRERYLGH